MEKQATARKEGNRPFAIFETEKYTVEFYFSEKGKNPLENKYLIIEKSNMNNIIKIIVLPEAKHFDEMLKLRVEISFNGITGDREFFVVKPNIEHAPGTNFDEDFSKLSQMPHLIRKRFVRMIDLYFNYDIKIEGYNEQQLKLYSAISDTLKKVKEDLITSVGIEDVKLRN